MNYQIKYVKFHVLLWLWHMSPYEVNMCMSVKRGHQSEIFSYYRNITPCHVQTKKRMELLYQTAPGKDKHKIT